MPLPARIRLCSLEPGTIAIFLPPVQTGRVEYALSPERAWQVAFVDQVAQKLALRRPADLSETVLLDQPTYLVQFGAVQKVGGMGRHENLAAALGVVLKLLNQLPHQSGIELILRLFDGQQRV